VLQNSIAQRAILQGWPVELKGMLELSLKFEPCRKLRCSTGCECAGSKTERCWRVQSGADGMRIETYAVRHVEHLPTQLQLHLFGQRE